MSPHMFHVPKILIKKSRMLFPQKLIPNIKFTTDNFRNKKITTTNLNLKYTNKRIIKVFISIKSKI